MRTKTLIIIAFALIFSVFLNKSGSAQHWRLGGNPPFGPDGVNAGNNILGSLPNVPLRIVSAGISRIHVNAILGPRTGFVGIGAGFAAPTQLLDVSGGNIDILTPTNSYMIDDSAVLWHNGSVNSIFVGVNAGGIAPVGPDNTFVGNRAGRHNSGPNNSFLGYSAGYSNISGDENTYLGYICGFTSTTARANTYIGSQCGYNTTTGSYNTMTGRECGYYNTTGYANCFYGKEACFHNTTGHDNSVFGDHVEWTTTIGSDNCAYGVQALYSNVNGNENISIGVNNMYSSISSGNNVAIGGQAMYHSLKGDANVVIGSTADFNGGSVIVGVDTLPHTANVFIGTRSVFSYLYGDSNVFVGALTDVGTTGHNITNSGAFGFGAVTTANNKIILGNNQQNIGIGMSGLDVGVGPTNRLEISYFSNTSPSPFLPAPPATFTPNGPGKPTGASGLQFRDLVAGSFQWPYVKKQGFLTVDDKGNVIYMSAPPCCMTDTTTDSTKVSAGYCPNPTTLTASAGYNLNNVANFYFGGNGAGTPVNNVLIGPVPCSTSTPLGKLDVLQNSGSTNGSTGIYVENDDATNATTPPIGIEAKIPLLPCSAVNPAVAGWFESPYCGAGLTTSYAIYVPQAPTGLLQGIVSLGLPFGSTPGGNDLLQIAGNGYSTGTWYSASDRRFKTNITNVTNALQKINSINPVYYYYDTASYPQYNFDSKQQVGFIAQNVDSALHQVVKVNNGFYSLDYSRMTALLLAGEKELKLKTDSMSSLKNTVDSMRAVLNSIQSCISKLCSDSSHRHSPTEALDGSSENVISVSLSNTAILYQNSPNPFDGNGTKINYFLPENTIGASIVFYDMYGNQLKVVQLTQTGMGTISVNPDKLTNGIYTYSLVINGNIVDTKKMVFAK